MAARLQSSLLHLALVTLLELSSVSASGTSLQEPIHVDFEDAYIKTTTPIGVLDGLKVSGFAGAEESLLGQSLNFNGSKAALTLNGNEISALPSAVDTGKTDQPYYAFIPQSVAVGCFTNVGVGQILGQSTPLSSLPLPQLRDFLFNGATAVATSCIVRVRVTEKLRVWATDQDQVSLRGLQAAGEDYVDCAFKATALPLTGLLGAGRGSMTKCDLPADKRAETVALTFSVQSVDAILNLGFKAGPASVLPVIDDFRAIGLVTSDGEECDGFKCERDAVSTDMQRM